MLRKILRGLGTILPALLTAGAALAAEAGNPGAIWMEGEKPTRANVKFRAAGWGKAEILSEGKWLHLSMSLEQMAKGLPKDGALLEYDFTVARAGKHEVWNRIGLEFARSAFEWRIDGGAWRTVTRRELTTDLMELDFWCEAGWLRMGTADLARGKHTIQIRHRRPFKETRTRKKGPDGKEIEVVEKKPDRIAYASDALCVFPGEFRPNGKFKPGEAWQSDDDKKAAEHVFDIQPAARPEQRIETSLKGLWQVCRYDEQEVHDRTEPTRTLPDAAKAYWMSIPVPGDKYTVKPHLTFCHRFVYRTRVRVPAGLKGRGFFLRLPSINMIASVFVNGRYCGGSKAMCALWDCDVTPAIKPGEVNEIAVVIKDTYYAASPAKTKQSCRMGFNVPLSFMHQNWLGQGFDFPVSSFHQAGILEEPSLIVAGGAYTSDVFAMPSVAEKRLALELTVRNTAAAERKVLIVNEVVPAGGGPAEKTFAPRTVTVRPGAEQVVKVSEPWANPKLWWPDRPHMYHVVTTLSVGGKVVDVSRTPFGFRQWQWDGPQFKLNGVPWQMWADVTDLGGRAGAEATLARWRRQGNNMWRFWGQGFAGMGQRATLDFMDAHGMPVRRSGLFDGQGANYLHGLANNKPLFDNWITQLTAQVRAERNHPSIFIWSMENEIVFINSRNLGMAKAVEPHITRAAQAVMAVDPTRPVMVDGGNCLMDNSLPVNGCHYVEMYWRDYPDEAYTLEKAFRAHLEPIMPTWGKSIWQLVPGRPIFMGESYFLRGYNPADFSQFGGEECFTGWAYTKRGGGLYAKMLAEGYRWQGVAAHHFWFGSEDTDLHHNSWKDVCVFCRQWNWTFAGGSKVPRTLKVFNDTRYADPIEMAWELRLAGKKVRGEKKSYSLKPGEHREVAVVVDVPAVEKRTAGEFILTCRRGGKEVFREVKKVAVLNAGAGPKPAFAAGELAVLDASGSVTARLRARGIAFTEVPKGGKFPAGVKVVVIGPDALTAREATDPKWLSLAARGLRVLVLDQTHPLHYQAVPADLIPTPHVGRIAFMEDATHPIFSGLAQEDFFTWSADHVVYRNVYTKASRGARSLAHCDGRLGCSAIAECGVNHGLLLLCQMVVGSKLATDPVAQRLFDNMLAYCRAYRPLRRATAVVFDEKTPTGKLLADSGLIHDKAPDALSAVRGGKHEIVVVEANQANLKALADSAPAVRAFTGKGGWLFLWGLTPKGLASFNKLVGVEHLIRPFERERVTLPPVRDPILSGLTMRDVVMSSGETIMFGDKFLASDVFTYVVDYDDIAPFCEFPPFDHFCKHRDKPGADNYPRNMVNGFVSADSWKYIFSMYPNFNGRMDFDLKLPRAETLLQLDVQPNAFYNIINKIELTYDGDKAGTVKLALDPDAGMQSLKLTPRKAKVVHINFADWDRRHQTDVIGIDNLSIKVKRSPEFYEKVKPLLNIGALVKYPQGAGGVLLCQLNILAREAVPENAAKKKNIVSTLLRNLGAPFAGAKLLVAGEGLTYAPVALEERCNQYLTRDRGWIGGSRDLGHLPVGRRKFAGVEYLLRDFKTSPLTSCVMLAGPGVKAKLPTEVKALPVARKADALFFLHAFHRIRSWRAPRRGDKTPPIVFKYVVHYADGKTADVPVRYGDGVDHWIATEPAGLKNATVAWAAAFPNDASGEKAVVYQMQWNNPRPGVEIRSVDLAYDASTRGRYGIPALLAVTAAKRID